MPAQRNFLCLGAKLSPLGLGSKPKSRLFPLEKSLHKPVLKVGLNMVFNFHRNHRAYQGQEEGSGGGYGGGGWEGRGRLYNYRYTVTTRMTPALRWAAMRAILMFH